MSLVYHSVSVEELIGKLRSFFDKLADVDVVVLFGSAVKRSTVRDVDILVHSRKDLSLRDVCKLSSKLEEVLGIPVDVVPLEEAYPHIVVKAIQEGVPVLVRDPTILADAYKKALGEIMDIEVKVKQASRERDHRGRLSRDKARAS